MSIQGNYVGGLIPSAEQVGARPDTWMPTAAEVGAAKVSHNHAATDITSGLLPLERGGTGVNLYNSTKDKPFGILRLSSDPDKYPFVYIEPTANGAFFATADNTDPKFGTLPIAQGGTGATTAADALANLGALPLAGGTAMTGNLDMGSNNITYLADPTGQMQATNKRYVDNGLSAKADATPSFGSVVDSPYHYFYFTKIGKLVICTFTQKTLSADVYNETITIPTGFTPSANRSFKIYSDTAHWQASGSNVNNGGNITVKASTNGNLSINDGGGYNYSTKEIQATIWWVTA